jgi:hypothetical protein
MSLQTIFDNMLTSEEGLKLDKKAVRVYVEQYFKDFVRQKSKYFGNGRADARKLAEKVIKSSEPSL